MCNCNCEKDQTPNEVFEYLETKSEKELKKKENQFGTGLFLVPDPEAGTFEEKVVTVESITYKDCSNRGQNCLAFKWIPQGYMSLTEIQEARVTACRNRRCRTSRDCQQFCICSRRGCI
jgi:hypothetical protein